MGARRQPRTIIEQILRDQYRNVEGLAVALGYRTPSSFSRGVYGERPIVYSRAVQLSMILGIELDSWYNREKQKAKLLQGVRVAAR